jgi:hypothetical protein
MRLGISGALLICILTSQASPQQTEITAEQSLVWIYKQDIAGHRTDKSLGFVIAPGQVATAFQAIDEAARLELSFADGRQATSREILACNRLQDWALIKVDTGRTPALRRIESGAERYSAFNVDADGTRTISQINVTGRRTLPGFGERIQIQPAPSHDAVGGPLLTQNNLVVGIVGGSVMPGNRIASEPVNEATPIAAVPTTTAGRPATLQTLLESGVLTPPVTSNPSLISAELSKNSDKLAWVHTVWQKRSRAGNGEITVKVFDVRNRLVVDRTPQKISLSETTPQPVPFEFSVLKLSAGIYRVDVFWNDQPVWRSFLTLTD